MPDGIAGIGDLFKTAMPAIEGVSMGTGILGNILNSITRGKQVGQLESAEKKFANLSPEQLSGLVTRAEQPLGQDLIQGINNQVQGDMAQRGLAEAPGVFAATEAQAIAPYKLQQQQLALQLVLKQMGLPIEYANAILQGSGGNSDMSKLMLMMLMNQNKGGGGGGNTSGISSTADLDSILFPSGGGTLPPPDGTTSSGDWSI